MKKCSSKRLWIDEDSQNILNYISNKVIPSWTIDNIIQEDKRIINNLEKVYISHLYKEANKVTDVLANVAVVLASPIHWNDDMGGV